jgi:hypothetical protein
MKAPYLIFLGIGLVGCSRVAPHTVALTEEKASDLARTLANAKAQALFDCQPFSDGPAARFDNGRWVWHHLCGRGRLDYEADVELAADGVTNRVDVDLLYSEGR